MNSSKVSVIIPVYNTEKYLQRCIDSLLMQTYENIEYIFVDDGSIDGSLNILKTAEKRDAKIIVIEQKNAGPSAARNTGMKVATGKYVMFCDSDDTVEQNWCEMLVVAIEKNPNAWVMCGVNMVDELGRTIKQRKHKCTEKKGKEDYFLLSCEGLAGYPVNKIFRKDILEENNIVFDEKIKRGEDVLFNLEYYKFVEEVFVLEECYYNYYRYENCTTLTNKYYNSLSETYQLLYVKCLPYISDKDLYDYKNYYWYIFINELNNTMDNNESDSLVSKIKINSKIVKSTEFQTLLLEYGEKDLNKICFICLKQKNYIAYWLIQMISKIKKKLFFFIKEENTCGSD